MTSHKPSDLRWMNVALAQAEMALGQTAENPAVGCAILSADNRLVGVGRTSPSGRPHAEVNALAMAGDAAKGGTAYVTLEPCAHHGKTPPCADALINAGISCVVIAHGDPDERVSGKGIARLEAAGITVRKGVGEAAAARQMAGFLSRQIKGRPFISLKMATSADGYITAEKGSQTWLTGELARRYVHAMRSRFDCVMTGSQTIMVDNPQLNVRLPGFSHQQPALAILDSHAQIPTNMACLNVQRPVFLYHALQADSAHLPKTVMPISITRDGTGLSLVDVMSDLAQRGISSIMIEAGRTLALSLINANLVDEIIWLKAPHKLGQGILAWDSASTLDFSAPKNYINSSSIMLGDDELGLWHPANRLS